MALPSVLIMEMWKCGNAILMRINSGKFAQIGEPKFNFRHFRAIHSKLIQLACLVAASCCLPHWVATRFVGHTLSWHFKELPLRPGWVISHLASDASRKTCREFINFPGHQPEDAVDAV